MIAPPKPPAQDAFEALINEAREREFRRRLLGTATIDRRRDRACDLRAHATRREGVHRLPWIRTAVVHLDWPNWRGPPLPYAQTATIVAFEFAGGPRMTARLPWSGPRARMRPSLPWSPSVV